MYKQNYKMWFMLTGLILLPLYGMAQFSIGPYPSLMLPEGSYKRELNINSAPGIGFHLFAPIVRDALEVPVLAVYTNVSLYRYAQERNLYNRSFANLGSSTRYNKVAFDLGLRLDPFEQYVVAPYLEAGLGLNVHYSRSSIDFGQNADDYDLVTEKSDLGVHYVGAGGVVVRLSPYLGLDLRLQYLQGSRVDFLTKGSIEEDPANPGFAFYDIKNAAPRRFAFSIGILFRFNAEDFVQDVEDFYWD